MGYGMSRCPSCGGILGRDCFNPIECAQITASMNDEQIVQPYAGALRECKKCQQKLTEHEIKYYGYCITCTNKLLS